MCEVDTSSSIKEGDCSMTFLGVFSVCNSYLIGFIAINVTSVSAEWNDSGSAKFTVLVLSLRPSSVIVYIMVRIEIEFLPEDLTGLSIPPSRVGSTSNVTGNSAVCACYTVTEQVKGLRALVGWALCCSFFGL